MLDVGCGNHSATLTMRWFPSCRYYGVDSRRDYDNDRSDYEAMAAFYELDLTLLDFSPIPDGRFDVLMMTHVIEHLHNGDLVLAGLLPKIKPGGLAYIEFPSERSTRLPSKKGTLNFYDDKTHARIYTPAEVERVFTDGGWRVLRSGRRRDWLRIITMPAAMVKSKLDLGYVAGSVFWDLLGFAEYVLAEKP
jgi:2-polyprenyl-3-methyl-5-hydroxy-6-metoxy-1,4-benzoquinol methylase